MITAVNEKTYDLRGLSTDVKPVDGIGNGSTYFCIDTLEVYMFDGESKTWKLLA